MKNLISQKAALWTFLGALAYCLCFPRWDIFYLSPLVSFCFLFAIHNFRSRKEALWLAFFASFMVGVGGFHWIVYVAENFGGLPLPAALGLLFAFCLVAAPQIYAFFWLGHRLRFSVERLPLWLRPLFWALLYTTLEFLARFVKIFPEHLGNSLLGSLSLAQAASLGGVSFLSFLPLFLGTSFYYLWKEGKRSLLITTLAILLPTIVAVWGHSQINKIEKIPATTLRVAMLQANIGDPEKIASERGNRDAITEVIQRYLALAEKAGKVDLVVWPETAYPMIFPARAAELDSIFAQGYANLVEDKARAMHVPFLFGGYEREAGRDYNSAILLGEDGKPQGSYRKVKLLMFGEWMPFSGWFPSLKELNPQMGDFAEGEGPVPLVWKRAGRALKLGVNICYEAIMPGYMHELAKGGADFFLNLTNDSWFGPTFEPWQHLNLAVLRAIENRRPLLRATNTGISIAVNAAGRITMMGPLFQEGLLHADITIPNQSISSIFLRFGELFAWLSTLSSLSLILYLGRRRS